MECSKIRRKDRAITDYHQMLEIMNQCDICRLYKMMKVFILFH